MKKNRCNICKKGSNELNSSNLCPDCDNKLQDMNAPSNINPATLTKKAAKKRKEEPSAPDIEELNHIRKINGLDNLSMKLYDMACKVAPETLLLPTSLVEKAASNPGLLCKNMPQKHKVDLPFPEISEVTSTRCPKALELDLYKLIEDYEELNPKEGFCASVPISLEAQAAVLAHCLADERLFLRIIKNVDSAFFNNPHLVIVWDHISTLYDTYGKPPTVSEIAESLKSHGSSQQSKRCVEELMKAVDSGGRFSQEFVNMELISALASWGIRRVASDLQNNYNQGKLIKTLHDLKKGVEEVCLMAAPPRRRVSFKDHVATIDQFQESLDKGLPFGVKTIDNILNPTEQGGLLPGNLTVLVAPSNRGKTTTCISVVRANVLKKKKVLFLTAEGDERNISQKLMSTFMGRTAKWLIENKAHPEFQSIFKRSTALMDEYLDWIHCPDLTNVEDIVLLIESEQQGQILSSGSGYDLIIHDYPGKLDSKKYHKLDRTNQVIKIYDQFRQLAEKFECHVLCPAQTNRAGLKASEGRDGNSSQKGGRLLHEDDIAEAYGVIQLASNVILINRTSKMQEEDVIVYSIAKSRSSITGVNVACNTDFGVSLSHSDEMGSCIYRGEYPLAEKLNHFITLYDGQTVPNQMLKREVAELQQLCNLIQAADES